MVLKSGLSRWSHSNYYDVSHRRKDPRAAAIQNMAEKKLLDGQWKTLVERIKASGKLQSSIAVCDVSGSMLSPTLPDQTNPMHSSIGLSLLLAEVTEPPFGGAIITFSSIPEVVKVGGSGDKRTFSEKVDHIMSSSIGYSTDFVAVFEKLILPMAIEAKLQPEDMVKQVFVFSDMQFNQAQEGADRWMTSYERIKAKYSAAGYEVPTLIFWNLAAGPVGKPVEADEPGTALVSGYSQAQMKVFLDSGEFTDTTAEEVLVVEETDEDGLVSVVTKKAKIDPVTVVHKAVSHRAYSMLKVYD